MTRSFIAVGLTSFAWLGLIASAMLARPSTLVAQEAPPSAPAATVQILVMAGPTGREAALRDWQPTGDYLAETIPGYRFEFVAGDSYQEHEQFVIDGIPEFVLTQPADYALMEVRYGLTRMATMRTRSSSGPVSRFASVVFVSRGSSIRRLEDLPGHRLAAVEERSFGGFQMTELLLREHGIDPRSDLGIVITGFPQTNVVAAVREGRAEAGTVRTGVLERMVADGQLRMDEIVVLSPVEDGFPFVHSTPLYPEWAFAVARHTDQGLSQRVAVALLDMPPDHPAARASRTAGWTVPLDYGSVHDVLRALRAAPYDRAPEVSVADVVAQYWHVIVGTLLGLLVMAVATLHVLRLNRRLGESNAALAEEIRERKRMEHQLLASEKMASLGQLAAGVAHEINNPLGYVYSNTTVVEHLLPPVLGLLDAYREAEATLEPSLRSRLESMREEAQLDYVVEELPQVMRENLEGLSRMRSIVRDMKSFSHIGDQDWQIVDLRETLKSTLNIARKEIEGKGEILTDYGDIPQIECLASQLAQVFMNLLSNARDAISAGGKVTVRTKQLDPDHIAIEVSDDGEGMGEEVQRRIFDPFFTTKPVGSGTGLGLSIAMRIVKTHRGRIEVDTERGKGSTFRVVLPIRSARESDSQPIAAE